MIHSLDNVWRDTRGEKFCCAADVKAVAHCAWIARDGPYLLAPSKKSHLHQHMWTRGGGIGK